jgi:NADH-quinone oxidoreductase subunit E
LSEKAIIETARYLDISETVVFGVASFYSEFRFTPPGEHSLKLCLGNYSLEAIACFGCCSLAPVMVVDDKVYGRMTPEKAKKIRGI